jgi:hypothetical protein
VALPLLQEEVVLGVINMMQPTLFLVELMQL